jgi:hypothetical protein
MKTNWPADKVERRKVASLDKTDAEWRAIPGSEGYEASSDGRVRSIPHAGLDGRAVTGRVLKPWSAAKCYQYVSLGSSKKIGVHRAVALAFLGEPPSLKHEAAHLDGNPSNNCADNIRWKTRVENEADKYAHGTWRRMGLPGERHHRAKLTDSAVLQIRAMFTGVRGEKKKIASKFGVDPATVGRVIRGAGWSHV